MEAERLAGLVRLLQSEFWTERRDAAKALRQLGWAPQTESETIAYRIAAEQWRELSKLGEKAVDLLIDIVCRTRGMPAPDQKIALEDAADEVYVELIEPELRGVRDYFLRDRALRTEMDREQFDSSYDDYLDDLVRALFDCGGARGADFAYRVLMSEDTYIGSLAALYLCERGDARGFDLLPSIISGRFCDNSLRWRAIRVAGERRVDSTLQSLGQVARDAKEELYTRLMAVSAVLGIGNDEAQELLREFARSDTDEVSSTASLALHVLTGESVQGT